MKTIKTNTVQGGILVILPRFIGDAINTLPAIAMLKELYPENAIHVLARPYLCELFESNTSQGIRVINDKRYDSSHKISTFRLSRLLRQHNFSMAILFRGSLREAWLCKLTGIDIVIGYAQNGRGLLLSHPLKLNLNHHYIHRYCRLINDTHGRIFQNYALPKLSSESFSLAVSEGKGKKIGVYFGGRNKGARHYPHELAAQALQRIFKNQEAQFFLFGDKTEQKDNQALCAYLTAMHLSVQDLSGCTSLKDLVNAIACCDLMISIDSGPMHIAAATETPCVAVVGFSASPWSLVAPKLKRFKALISSSTSLDESKIIHAIQPDDIAKAALDLLGV